MAYVDQGGQANRKTAVIGVAAIHGVIGTVLISGLATGVFIPVEDKPFEGENIEVEITPPPKPEKVEEVTEPQQQSDPTIYVPEPPFTFSQEDPGFETTEVLPPPGAELIGEIIPPQIPGLGTATPPTAPTFDPVAAKPSNNAGLWVTNHDYRDSWVNRGYEGLARFSVTVDTNGRVKDCQITTSTGHRALDRATCNLVKRRARFEPALNSNGKKVIDTYSKSILWQLPE